MRVSYVHTAFPNSAIADRVVAALEELPICKLQYLQESGALNLSARASSILSYRNLRWEYLSDYALACELPVSDFVFGENIPVNAGYSHFDEEVFALLSVIPQELLVPATQVVQNTFQNAKMRIGYMSAPSKMISLALLSHRLPELVPEEELGKYRTNINEVLTYFRKARIKERCMLNIDYIADLCAYFKVSPHWAFSLIVPLLCETSAGDAFFDIFCFLSRQQQVYAMAMLLELSPEAKDSLKPEMLKRIQMIIAAEGGVVL